MKTMEEKLCDCGRAIIWADEAMCAECKSDADAAFEYACNKSEQGDYPTGDINNCRLYPHECSYCGYYLTCMGQTKI